MADDGQRLDASLQLTMAMLMSTTAIAAVLARKGLVAETEFAKELEQLQDRRDEPLRGDVFNTVVELFRQVIRTAKS